MFASATLRERLPSAAAAIGVQLGLLALLAASFEVVRRVSVEHETFLALPPLPQARPQQKPLVIDVRRPPLRPVTIAPTLSLPGLPQAPSTFTQSQAPVLAQPPGLIDCRPENYVRLNGTERTTCARAEGRPRDDRTMPLNPNPPVRNAPIWQSEIGRRNTPLRVPCVSLTNNAVGMGGFQKEDHGVSVDIACALKALRDGPEFLPPVRGLPDPNPPRTHASNDAFGKALQMVNDRKRALYARPAPPQDAGKGASP